jgi:hypothetical protein
MSTIVAPGVIDTLDVTPAIKRALADFVSAQRTTFGQALHSITLFGSAAEGRMRQHSDVNLMTVLTNVDRATFGRLSGDYRAAHAAARISCMFIRLDEIPAAYRSFAVKFEDIANRRRILFGDDPFAGIEMSADDMRRRVREDLLNLALRLRERTIFHSAAPEQFEALIFEVSAAVRVAAAAILWLEGAPGLAPREALERLLQSGEKRWLRTARTISEVRQNLAVSRQSMLSAVDDLHDITAWMRKRIGD